MLTFSLGACCACSAGNGLRPEIWGQFQERFNVPEVGEFYGATEGNGALCNHCTVPEARGACGRGGWLMKRIMGFKIVAFDVVEEAPVRGGDGFCRECPNNVAGELLMPIKQGDPSTQFVGYHNNARHDSAAEHFSLFSIGRALLFTATAWIFIPAHLLLHFP